MQSKFLLQIRKPIHYCKKMHRMFQLNQKYRVFAVNLDLQRTYYHANNKQYLCNSQNFIIEEKNLHGADFPYYYKYSDGNKQLSNDIDDYVLIPYHSYLICFIYDKIYHINKVDGAVSILYQRNKKLDEKLYNMLKLEDQAKYNSNRYGIISDYIIENTLDKVQLINQYQLYNLTSFLSLQAKKPYFITPIYHRFKNKYFYLYNQNSFKTLYIPSINSSIEIIEHQSNIIGQSNLKEVKHSTKLQSITDQTLLLIQNNDLQQHEIIKYLQENFFKYYPLISLELRSTQYQMNFESMDCYIRDKFVQNSLENIKYILDNVQSLDCQVFMQLFNYYSQEQLSQAINKLADKKEDILKCNNSTIILLAQLDNKMYEKDATYQFTLLGILMKHSQFYSILEPSRPYIQIKKQSCQITSIISQPKGHSIKEHLYLSQPQYNYVVQTADSEEAVQLLCINVNSIYDDIQERLIIKIENNRIPRLLRKLIECCLRHSNLVDLTKLSMLLTKLKIDYQSIENQPNMPFDSSELLASSTLLQFLSTDYDKLRPQQRQQLVNLVIWSINNKIDNEMFNEQISFNYRVIVLSAYMRVLLNCFDRHLLYKNAEYKQVIDYTMSFEELILNQFIQYQYQQDIIEYIFGYFDIMHQFFTQYKTINSVYNNQQINLGCSLLELIFNQNKNIYLYTSNFKNIFCFQNIILDEQFVNNVLNKIKFDDLVRLIQIIPFRAICPYLAKMKNSNISRRETQELIKTLSVYKDYYGRSYLYYTFHAMTGRLIEAACTYFFNNGISRNEQIEFGYFEHKPDLDCFGRTKQQFGQLLEIATNDSTNSREDSEYSFRLQAPSLDYKDDSYDYSNIDDNSFT